MRQEWGWEREFGRVESYLQLLVREHLLAGRHHRHGLAAAPAGLQNEGGVELEVRGGGGQEGVRRERGEIRGESGEGRRLTSPGRASEPQWPMPGERITCALVVIGS